MLLSAGAFFNKFLMPEKLYCTVSVGKLTLYSICKPKITLISLNNKQVRNIYGGRLCVSSLIRTFALLYEQERKSIGGDEWRY